MMALSGMQIENSDVQFTGVHAGARAFGTDKHSYVFPSGPAYWGSVADNLREAASCRVFHYEHDEAISEFPMELLPSFTQPLSLLTLCTDGYTPNAVPTARKGIGWSLAVGIPLALSSASVGLAHDMALQQLAAKSAQLASAFVGPVEQSTASQSVGEQIVLELQGLSDGWGGPDSVAPSASLIADVSTFFSKFGIKENGHPDVQVDEDGTVAMFWRSQPRRLFSINFGGEGVVVVSYVSPVVSERFAERVIIQDGVALMRALAKSKMGWAVARRA